MKKHNFLFISMVLLCVIFVSCREDDTLSPEMKKVETTDSELRNSTNFQEFHTLSGETDPSVVEFLKKYKSDTNFKRRINAERSDEALTSAITKSRREERIQNETIQKLK